MLDVRVKFLILSTLSLLSVFYQTPLSLLILFFTSLIILIILKIKPTYIIKRLKSIFKLLLIMVLLQSVFTSSVNPILSVMNFTIISYEGLYRASTFLLRMLILIFSASILSNNDSREITQGLIQLKIPYEICLMSVMGVKFIPILRDHFSDTFLAIQLRGIDIKEKKLKEKITLISYMLLPVIISSINTAREVSISMQLKGFRAYEIRTSYFTLHFKTIDIISIFFVFVYAILFIIINNNFI